MMMDMVVLIFGYHVGINANTKNRMAILGREKPW